ncbi:MAG: homocysteine S-methyltransferase family protein [Oscillospiraceae bacterium]|nr:homocysteine S-methyltransferase family protein [Oscillospiraceae bacterium]
MLQLGKNVIVFDGGFGSELERRGLSGGIPEDLNITNPEDIQAIHKAYSCADIASANTFGLNRIKYHGAYTLEEVAKQAIENARASGNKVFVDIGPTGMMLEPLGTLTFDEAYNAFAEIADITKDLADGYIAETFSDLYELKACILALKEHTDKPIFATVTFDSTGRTLTGSTPEIVANTLEGLGVDALGVNCSLGPKELLPVVQRLLSSTTLPVIVQPNRGLPVLENGKTVYKLDIDEFEQYTEKMLEMGVSVIGGCCGTTPDFIQRISRFSGAPVNRPEIEPKTAVNSATILTEIEGVKICGERLNPTGKKALKEALLTENYDYLIDEALKQQEAGADLLDINVGLPQLDEPTVMPLVVRKIQEYTDLPLQIDSSDAGAIEAGVRYANGIPLINSVNGEEEVMAKIFPIAKKYGAVVLGLTMDKNGVPPTAQGRYEIAKRMIARANDFGIPKHKIMIDTLVVTASAEQAMVKETLEALRLVKALGVKTALGVSNVSFGLPNRPLLNRTFLTMAMTCGLNMPILNPLDGEMTGAIKAHAVLSGEDENSEKYIETYKDYTAASAAALAAAKSTEKTAATLSDCVKQGLKNRAEELCEAELQQHDPMYVVNEILIKALEEVGNGYESGKLFLPQLVAAAEAAKQAFAVIGRHLPKDAEPKGKIILATVKGDVHDIGKNIVKVVLESYGYNVIDLGKDVPAEKVVSAYKEHAPIAIGLSALMTTTVKGMEETIAALRSENCKAKIFVGGAVLNAETAQEINADHYTKDALAFAKLLDELCGK